MNATSPRPRVSTPPITADEARIVAAIDGDELAFTELSERHRREIHVHCYRMLASYDEAEDAVQETFLRAWRSRSTFQGGTLFRAWLYRIATNVCLDAVRKRARQPAAGSLTSMSEVAHLQPYPDRLLDELTSTPSSDEPGAVVVDRETIELAFVAALQALPPRQRVVLVARDVLDWPASETASVLGTSVAAVNSALQRARATMHGRLPAQRGDWSGTTSLSPEERDVLARFIDAHERCDAPAALAAAAEDIRVTMPPNPWCFDGLEAIKPLLERAFGDDREGDWRLLPTSANRMPAAASYLRRPGDSTFKAFKLDVLRVVDGKIAEITTFGWSLFEQFDLPLVVPTDEQ